MDLKLASWQKRVGVGSEGSYGIATADDIHRYIGTDKESFDLKYDSRYKTSFGVSRTETDTFKTEQVLAPSLTFDVQPDNIGEVLLAWAGTWSSGTQTTNAAGTQYKHTFKPAGTIQDSTFTSLLFKLDYGQGTVYDYFGCRLNKLSFSIAPKENLKCMAEFIGQREAAGTSAPVAVAYGSFQPWDFSDMEIYIDGTMMDGIMALDISLDNKLTDGFRLGTQNYTTRPLPGDRMTNEVKFMNEFNAVDRARYTGGTAVGITIRFWGQTIGGTGRNEMFIRYPKVDYQMSPIDEKEGIVTLGITGRGLENGTSFAGTGFPIQIELFNTVNAY